MLNPFAETFVPSFCKERLDKISSTEDNTVSEVCDLRTNYDHIIEKLCILKYMFPAGTDIPHLISSYLFLDLNGVVEHCRFKVIQDNKKNFPINYLNQMVKNCRYLNDSQGRFLWNSSTIYKYFEITKEQTNGDEHTLELELKTKMKSIWLGPVRFCAKSGEYCENCSCDVCNEQNEHIIVFSDSDEEADIIF